MKQQNPNRRAWIFRINVSENTPLRSIFRTQTTVRYRSRPSGFCKEPSGEEQPHQPYGRDALHSAPTQTRKETGNGTRNSPPPSADRRSAYSINALSTVSAIVLVYFEKYPFKPSASGFMPALPLCQSIGHTSPYCSKCCRASIMRNVSCTDRPRGISLMT